LFFFLDKKEPKNQGCRKFWGSCFSACPRNTTRRPSSSSNSIAYLSPPQQASKQALSLQSGSFAKIAHRAIF
jgi:hypothetical protein